MAQRWRALECAVDQGSWQMGQHLEFGPTEQRSLLSVNETQLLVKREMLQTKLQEARVKTRKGQGVESSSKARVGARPPYA